MRAWLCFCMQASESVKHRGRERERVRKSLFSAPGSMDVVELFMRFFDAILTALSHRGNNREFRTREHAREMTAFITHLGQLTAHWCHGDSPVEQLGFLMSVPVKKSHWHQAGLRDKDNYSALPRSWFMCEMELLKC